MVFKRLAGHGGVVQHLLAHHLTQQFVLRQLLGQVVVVSQFFHFTHAVHDDDFLEALVGVGVAHDAQIGRQASAGAQEVEVFARQQIIDQQSARGFASDDDFVADLYMLQPRCKRAVLYLDTEKLQVFFVIRTDNAVGAQQGFAVNF